MKDWLINLVGSYFGLAKVVEALDGYKTYLAGVSLMLTGAATAMTGAAGLLNEVLPLHTLADYLAWMKALSHDTNMGLIAAGAAMVSKGLADIGNRHATAKLEAKMVTLTTDPGPIVIPLPKK